MTVYSQTGMKSLEPLELTGVWGLSVLSARDSYLRESDRVGLKGAAKHALEVEVYVPGRPNAAEAKTTELICDHGESKLE